MPMPASTFTLAVGHWCQVPADTPSALEKVVEDGMGSSNSKAELVPGLIKSSSEVVRDSPLHIGRYFNGFPVSFSCRKTTSSPDCC